MTALPKQIIDLVQRFERNLESYRSQGYNETQLRREFIDPFFETLGWDVTNKDGHAEAYKDVIHEDAIKVGSATKAPDYCFRIGGARKFFLEAKKPSVSIKDDISPAYQLRRYAWSAKLPLSILTDFEEFAVYDCRIPPKPNDKPSLSRILYLSYKEYATRWDEIASIFSKDAVLKGSFDKYAISERKRGTATVDTEFLIEIEAWRDALARNLALRNPKLTVRDLNFAVQRTIDRIIFLRMCEDRGIESYGQLQALLNGENIYDRLRYIYGLADDRYNSGLFHFKPEKERAEPPDELTPILSIDDKVLKDIIRRLYYPESPYEFSVLSADILGNVYEQFLGKVIRLTAGHRAVIEEKPEVKKAGGVYYTPAYIVNYIVKNTVGKLCDGKTPKQIAKLRILDPACGSGSFLIGAYAYLLNYHRDWYVKDGAEKHTKEIYQGAGGQWLLTTQEKKRMLLNNIYGVDIDSQAVEVTKLSLLLKVLEGENQDTLNRQLKMWRERALPDLGSNIKCGNSLIGPDYYEGRQTTMFDDEEVRRVNAFDWAAEFPEIMKSGGFDAVIGNPPWVTIEKSVMGEPSWNYLRSKYKSVDVFKLNTFPMFVECGLRLIGKNGRVGFILPNRLLDTPSYKLLRRILRENSAIDSIVDIPRGSFENVIAGNIILILSLQPKQRFSIIRNLFIGEQLSDMATTEEREFSFMKPDGYVINLNITPQNEMLLEKIERASLSLGGLFGIHVGMMIKDKFDLFLTRPKRGTVPIVMGRDFNRYTNPKSKFIDLKHAVVFGGTKNPEKQAVRPKLFVRKTGNKLICAIDEKGVFAEQSVYLLLPKTLLSPKYYCALINSKLLTFFFLNKLITNPEAYPYIQHYDLSALPVRVLNLSDSADKARHDKMAALVERMLDLHRRLNAAKTPDDKTKLQRQIATTDKQIDQLVYELYRLTEEEIRIVEGDK